MLFTPSRERTLALRQARDFITGEKYADALKILQTLIDSDNDTFFFEDADRRDKFLSLKGESMRLIETLPKKGRDVYELTFGLKAQALLKEASEKGDFAGVETVARRFFHTQAGYRATYLLAIRRSDGGDPLSAALHFERLRKLKGKEDRDQFEPMLSLQAGVCWARAGLPKAAVATLTEFKASLQGRPIKVGGRYVALFDDRQNALKWLADTLGNSRGFADVGKEQWAMFRGNPTRTASSSPASPVWDAKWNVDTVRGPDSDYTALDKVADTIASLSQTRRKEGLLMPPAGHPLLVGGLAVFRTLQNVWAVNVRTGEVVWKSDVKDHSFRQLAGLETAPYQNIRRSYSSRIMRTPMETLLDQRLWRDVTAGTLSSDGDLIFSLDNLGFYDRSVRYIRIGGRTQLLTNMNGENTLTAFNAKTGERLFQLGGKASEKRLLAGHFFLGAPLPLGNRLFVLADYRGEIRLYSLGLRKYRWRDGSLAATPSVRWMQSLVTPYEGVSRSPLRRMAGLSPSCAGGVLLCPTTSGAVVAVDPARRLLLWGYRYPTNTDDDRSGVRPPNQLPTNPHDAESRWLDAGITVAGSRIILTPRDSDELHCVDMHGEVVWKQPRGQRLYVAAVHDDHLIVVGKSQIEAINLADGSPAWKANTPLPLPSGRGFQTADLYHLPLETGEIATIDLKSGRVLAEAKTRSGLVPGNLVAADGLIVSQSVDGVFGFKPSDVLQADIAARLKANPTDGAALAIRGEIRLRSGDEEGGLSDLRAAGVAGGQDRARSLIASNLMERLRLDFAGYRKHRGELERILTDEKQRERYRRLLAAGLHEIGEYPDAFRQYLKLAGPFAGRWKNHRSGDVTVRGDRWLQSRILDVFRKAGKTDRGRIIAQTREQLRQAVRFGGPEGLRRFLRAFGEFPEADAARRMLAERLNSADDALELEFVLLKLRSSDDLPTAAFATARLARLFTWNRQDVAAAECVAELEGRFGKTDCGQGKSGARIAAELRKERPPVTTALSARSPWPEKRILVKSTHNQTPTSYGQTCYAEFLGDRGVFRGWTFSLATNTREIQARDGQGIVRWTLPFSGVSSSNYYYSTTVRAYGHLLVITMADRFLVVNALHARPRILWQRSLLPIASVPNGNQITGRWIQVGGRRKWVGTDRGGNPLGMVGYVGNQAIVFQSGRTLYAADPLTGDVLWHRGSVERGSRLFGDEQHLFVVGPNSTTAIVLRAGDGQSVGTRPVAPNDDSKLTRGRFELRWRLSGGNHVLSWVDLLANKTIWRKQYSALARMETVHEDEAAVVEPSKGRLHVVSLTDGKPRVDSPIQSDAAIDDFLIRRSPTRYLLITHGTTSKDGKILSVNGVNYPDPLVNGHVYGFDRKTGKRIWTNYVGNQAVESGQPETLPVLVFAASRYEDIRQGKITRRANKLAITILDTRNGRILLDYSAVEGPSPYLLAIDPLKKRIDVKFRQTRVTLTMGEEPLGQPGNRVVTPKADK
jgi:outer membrane protein assembly factor BamB